MRSTQRSTAVKFPSEVTWPRCAADSPATIDPSTLAFRPLVLVSFDLDPLTQSHFRRHMKRTQTATVATLQIEAFCPRGTCPNKYGKQEITEAAVDLMSFPTGAVPSKQRRIVSEHASGDCITNVKLPQQEETTKDTSVAHC